MDSVASPLTAILFLDRSHKLWNTLSNGRYILSIPYAGYAGMLLNINGMFIMREVVVKFRSEQALAANFYVYVKAGSRPSCICDVLYFKFNERDAINIFTKPGHHIYQWNVKVNDGSSIFPFFLRNLCMKSASYQ